MENERRHGTMEFQKIKTKQKRKKPLGDECILKKMECRIEEKTIISTPTLSSISHRVIFQIFSFSNLHIAIVKGEIMPRFHWNEIKQSFSGFFIFGTVLVI